jgi:drug/metabolite transporter (DMT)-like permease
VGAAAAAWLVYYSFTQGGQFLSLKYLDAITLSLMLNFSAPLVAVIGLVVLRESVSKLQWSGWSLFLLGYWSISSSNQFAKSTLGLALGAFTVLSNAIAAVMGRGINRQRTWTQLW